MLTYAGALPLTPRVQEGIDDGIAECRHDGVLVVLRGGMARRMAGLGNVRVRRTRGGNAGRKSSIDCLYATVLATATAVLLLGLAVVLALHSALLQLLGNLPCRYAGRRGGCRLRRWSLALGVGVLFLLAPYASHRVPALEGRCYCRVRYFC